MKMKKMLVVLAVLLSIAMVSFGLTGCSKKKAEETPVAEMQTQAAPSQTQLNAENLTSQAAAKAEAVSTSMQPGAVPASTPEVAQTVTSVAKPTGEEIQTALKNAGYYSGVIDGKLGPKSKKAIEDFQKDNGLVADGKVGAKTWSKLQAHLNVIPAQKTGD